ncbi:hypothetical protein RUM43_005513 [Polyplax serrata]|uniref:Uncharacterized protein n=1 Tax=Polyplax serrata TaxID=468196 RepID=A0AAN8NW65_POLSC
MVMKMIMGDHGKEIGLTDNPTFAIISEVYDNENANEYFEIELERALEAGCSVIVIEPSRLGDETARWIAVGNCLHKTAVAAGMLSVVTALAWTERPYICLPFGVLSLLCTGVYTLSWQFDPCVKYQVETNLKKLVAAFPQLGFLPTLVPGDSQKPSTAISPFNSMPTNPVVLVRKDNTKKRMLHSGLSFVAAIFCMWRLYDNLK